MGTLGGRRHCLSKALPPALLLPAVRQLI